MIQSPKRHPGELRRGRNPSNPYTHPPGKPPAPRQAFPCHHLSQEEKSPGCSCQGSRVYFQPAPWKALGAEHPGCHCHSATVTMPQHAWLHATDSAGILACGLDKPGPAVGSHLPAGAGCHEEKNMGHQYALVAKNATNLLGCSRKASPPGLGRGTFPASSTAGVQGSVLGSQHRRALIFWAVQ